MGIVKRTKSVVTLLDIFEHTNEALSAIVLVERLKAEMNKTTVYRILDRLEEEGVIHAFKGQEGLLWYAKCKRCGPSDHSDVHHHFQCRDCGKTECLNFNLPLPSFPSHKVEKAELLLIGLCQNCFS